MTKINYLISENDATTVIAQYTPRGIKEGGYQTESQLEKSFIDSLSLQGYEAANIKTHNNLKQNLRLQMSKLNNYEFTDKEWESFYNDVLANKKDTSVDKTRKIQDEIKFEITKDDGSKKNIKIIDTRDIHNNSLQVINQYISADGKKLSRYDVTILVNGLPLVHIELKRRGVSLRDAFNQIKRYQDKSFARGEGLFEWAQIFVISNGTETKYYSNTTRNEAIDACTGSNKNTFEFTSYWADAQNHNILEISDFAKTFFAKRTLLNILTKYCVFTADEKLLVMRPYQIAATERILNRIKCAHHSRDFGKVKAGGYIWHTTGSGKTLTSFKTAVLASQMQFDEKGQTAIDKVLFIVDRKDLDYQTMKEYNRFQEGCANSNADTKVLARQLDDPNCKIIITTIQKLTIFIKRNAQHDIYNKEVVLIFDECHRSQFGGMHNSIIRKFKKYYIFGFTGTPIFEKNSAATYKTTEMLFGEKLHVYTIVDAINDKNVLKFRVHTASTLKSKNDKEAKPAEIRRALMNPQRISKIVDYTLEHFDQYTKTKEAYVHNTLSNVAEVAKNHKTKEMRQKQNIGGFNSIFACQSIEMAKAYYSEFRKRQSNLRIAAIYSFSSSEEIDGLFEENNENVDSLSKDDKNFLEEAIKDYNGYFGVSYDTSAEKFQNYYKDLSLRMKNREIDILIVVNMFLTGFDAPTLNTLWVDKDLRYHGLIQAFSRTNRILNTVKSFGNIVSFRDLEENMDDALLLFGNKESKSVVLLRPYDDYLHGYTDNDGKKVQGYLELVEDLRKYKDGVPITDAGKKEYVETFNKFLKVRNILTVFDKFAIDDKVTPRELQDYQGFYLQIYDHFRPPQTTFSAPPEEIDDDLVFEIELVKQVEVNIDYILDLIAKNSGNKDSQEPAAIENIESAMDSSIQLRNRKDILNDFIKHIADKQIVGEAVYKEFDVFIDKKRKEEFNRLVKEQNLNETKTYEFIQKVFRTGHVESGGEDIMKLFNENKSSRFTAAGAAQIENNKQTLVNEITRFYERFSGISSKEF
jgi:type I restriction enzyme R subunit